MNPQMQAWDRLEEVTACLEAVSDLMNPEPDLHAVNRDKMALLLTFLIAEQRRAFKNLGPADWSDKVLRFDKKSN